MSALFSFVIDAALVGLLITGIVYAVRLSHQLTNLRASHAEMENFVSNFSATVQRAEAGVRGLKQAARSDGDELEKLLERAHTIRDELKFLIASADQIADRLSDSASGALAEPKAAGQSALNPGASQQPATKAERELMQALKKMG